MRLVKVVCPQCGGSVEVDKSFKTARCPFCNSSFVIDDKDDEIEHSRQSVLATTIVECDTNDVKKELEIYSLFGWDFKERKMLRVSDGVIRYTDGTSKTKYKDAVQLIFQRDVKSSWCTKELLLKEKEFFKLRKDYLIELDKYKREIAGLLDLYKDSKKDNRSAMFIGITFGVSVFFTVALLIAWALSSNYFCGIAALIVILFGIIGTILLTRKSNKAQNKEKKAFAKVLENKGNEFYEKEKLNVDNMNKIAVWAGEQMEKKFGYKITPSFDLSGIELFKLKDN